MRPAQQQPRITPTQRIRFRNIHARAWQAAEGVNWCCADHASMTHETLQAYLGAFADLKPQDLDGYELVLAGVTEFLEELENLAVLYHPGINVWTLGEA